MHKFGTNIFFFLLGISGLYVAYYSWKSYQTRLPQADIYVWGDSRMYWGLNVELLSELTGQTICATQQEGASVYDMLTFVRRVPNNSTCILGLSECVLFRNHQSDYNRSGFNIWATYELLLSGYKIKDVYGVCKLNEWTPKDIETISHDYFVPADTIVTPEPMPGWVKMYNTSFPYFEAKSKCYEVAVAKLMEKDCKVILLDFPGYRDVETMAIETPNRQKSLAYVEHICSKFGLSRDKIMLQSNQLLHYDLSHFNCIGAQMVSEYLANVLDTINQNMYIKIEIQ